MYSLYFLSMKSLIINKYFALLFGAEKVWVSLMRLHLYARIYPKELLWDLMSNTDVLQSLERSCCYEFECVCVYIKVWWWKKLLSIRCIRMRMEFTIPQSIVHIVHNVYHMTIVCVTENVAKLQTGSPKLSVRIQYAHTKYTTKTLYTYALIVYCILYTLF